MRHRRLKRKLGVKSAHREALLRNLVRCLVTHKRIETTYAKAKEASSFADRMVTLAKRGGLHARKLLISKLHCEHSAGVLIDKIAPQFKERNGGYTRVLRMSGHRVGDGAEMALLEFSVLIPEPEKAVKPKKEKKKDTKPHAAVEVEKPKKEKAKKEKEVEEVKPHKAPAAKADKAEVEKGKEQEKKESEKKGGFLGALRKFLKGDEK